MKKLILLFAIMLSVNTYAMPPLPQIGTNPEKLVIKNQDENYQFQLLELPNRVQIQQKDIGSIKLVIEKENGKVSNYSWMIQSKVLNDGTISINPKRLEIGSYTLIINTSLGVVKTPLIAQLVVPPVPDVVPGQPGDQYRTIIELPEYYYFGQMVKIGIDIPQGETYEWTVVDAEKNEEKFIQYTDSFNYTPTQVGFHSIALKAYKGSKLVSQWSGYFYVKSEPAIELSYRVGQTVNIGFTKGYELYNCSVNYNTENCTSLERFEYKFKTPGEYVLTFYLKAVSPDATMAFRKLTYLVTIK